MSEKKVINIVSIFVAIMSCCAAQAWPFFGWGGKQEEKSELAIPFVQPIHFTLVIDPAGDERDTGREIGDGFERTCTFHCAEEIKRSIESKRSDVRVVLTRTPGEIADQMHIAAAANKMPVDLYLSLGCYESKDKLPKFYLYRVIYNPATDIWVKKADTLALVPFDQAYKMHSKKTEQLIHSFYSALKKEEKEYHITTHEPVGMPFKPLMGINAPAIGLEMGCKKSEGWRDTVPLIILALEQLISEQVPHV